MPLSGASSETRRPSRVRTLPIPAASPSAVPGCHSRGSTLRDARTVPAALPSVRRSGVRQTNHPFKSLPRAPATPSITPYKLRLTSAQQNPAAATSAKDHPRRHVPVWSHAIVFSPSRAAPAHGFSDRVALAASALAEEFSNWRADTQIRGQPMKSANVEGNVLGQRRH